ncbi:oligodendrocyte transcription factor 1 [Lampris incognitus]|uniref:oligodendrocyte transcription factor 1 n=1 Tax=Lampris incognitus TaxID=2546036 RepID=UPI0024B6353E|nr:oligodendrocyte transcription factor 1 [Lampris incognitus]
MNVLSNNMLRSPEQSIPLCGPGSAQDLPRCPPVFNPSSSLHPGSVVNLQGPHRAAKPHRELSPEEQQELRRKINSRERRRMQDLNVAMDALREVMVPYASSPSSVSSTHHHQPGAPPGRRLSKISTLVLARNYILLLGSSLQEMRRLLGEVSVGVGVNSSSIPRLLLAGGWPLISTPGQLLLSPESLLTSAASAAPPSSSTSAATAKCPLLSPGPMEAPLAPVQWSSAGAPGGPLCPCGVCRLPRFSHSSPGPRFPK